MADLHYQVSLKGNKCKRPPYRTTKPKKGTRNIRASTIVEKVFVYPMPPTKQCKKDYQKNRLFLYPYSHYGNVISHDALIMLF